MDVGIKEHRAKREKRQNLQEDGVGEKIRTHRPSSAPYQTPDGWAGSGSGSSGILAVAKNNMVISIRGERVNEASS